MRFLIPYNLLHLIWGHLIFLTLTKHVQILGGVHRTALRKLPWAEMGKEERHFENSEEQTRTQIKNS